MMSYLNLLFNDSQDLSDCELLYIVDSLEVEILLGDPPDCELLSDVEQVEKTCSEDLVNWGSNIDSQVLCTIHDLESCKILNQSNNSEMAEHWGDVSDSQLLSEVMLIESSLNNLLGPTPQSNHRNFAVYQGPAVPMPTMLSTFLK